MPGLQEAGGPRQQQHEPQMRRVSPRLPYSRRHPHHARRRRQNRPIVAARVRHKTKPDCHTTKPDFSAMPHASAMPRAHAVLVLCRAKTTRCVILSTVCLRGRFRARRLVARNLLQILGFLHMGESGKARWLNTIVTAFGLHATKWAADDSNELNGSQRGGRR